jgi:hypothetical protein
MAENQSKNLFEKTDPEQYQKCAVPFATADEANAAIHAFWDEVYELRCKHNIANVSFVILDEIAGSGSFFIYNHIGDQMTAESMAAWMFGQASADRQDLVRKMVESGLEHAIKNAKNKR